MYLFKKMFQNKPRNKNHYPKHLLRIVIFLFVLWKNWGHYNLLLRLSDLLKPLIKKNLDSTCLRFVVQTRIKIRVRIQSRQSMFFLAVKIVHGKIGNCLDNNWRNLTTSRSNGFQAFFIDISTTFQCFQNIVWFISK